MKKLFLASYFSGVAALLPEFTQHTCSGKKVVFIPTASIIEKVTFYVGADKKSLEKLGLIIDELEISKASPDGPFKSEARKREGIEKTSPEPVE